MEHHKRKKMNMHIEQNSKMKIENMDPQKRKYGSTNE